VTGCIVVHLCIFPDVDDELLATRIDAKDDVLCSPHTRKWEKEGSLDQKCRVEKIHGPRRARFGKSERDQLAVLIRRD